MKNLKVVILAGVLLSASTALSDTIYNNTILTGPATSIASQEIIILDDVLVPSSRDPSQLPISIKSITVNVDGAVGQSGQFGIYLFPVNSNGVPDGSPVLISTTFATFTAPSQLVTFGGGASTLFTVNPNFTAKPGSGLFYLGLVSSSIGAGWLWANGPDMNLPTAYSYQISSGNFVLLKSPGPPFPPNFSTYISIAGTTVPEPSTLFLFGTGAAFMVARGYRGRRRIANRTTCSVAPN